jgi:hypothetical protein
MSLHTLRCQFENHFSLTQQTGSYASAHWSRQGVTLALTVRYRRLLHSNNEWDGSSPPSRNYPCVAATLFRATAGLSPALRLPGKDGGIRTHMPHPVTFSVRRKRHVLLARRTLQICVASSLHYLMRQLAAVQASHLPFGTLSFGSSLPYLFGVENPQWTIPRCKLPMKFFH